MISLKPVSSKDRAVTPAAEQWHGASRISHADELQLACRLSECRREMLTLILSAPACLSELRRIRTELNSRRLRVEDVVELAERSNEEGRAAFDAWLGRVESLQQEAPTRSAEALLESSLEVVGSLNLTIPVVVRLVGSVSGSITDAPLASPAARGTLSPLVQRRLRRLEAEVQRIRDRFMTANQGLVTYVVQRYLGMGLSHDDLMQEGNIGLMRAIEKFDHRRGGRFGTYAVWWVRQGVRRSLANQSRTIRIPVHALGTRYSLDQTARKLSSQLGRDPTTEELSGATGVAAGNVTQLLTLAKEPLSLDAPKGPDSDVRLGDSLPDSSASNGMQQVVSKQRCEQVRNLLGSLSTR
ncbi:MAG TPA: sigma-70 family RNA polymerase sigma factor, partial [Polyangiaceae bacterium]|nr:sigma-70 family RNA polymerase sigma factor [Polyangiaceae bacterium]